MMNGHPRVSGALRHAATTCASCVFLTDGYVGNDMEIVGEVQKHPNARVFAFGIGTAVNRFLLDKMAEAGRGAVEYVNLADKADEAADRFYERVRSPLLTDLYIDWGGLPVTDVYPTRLPDLFSGQPLVITGRYTQSASGKSTSERHARWRTLHAGYPRCLLFEHAAFDALAGFWARRRIDSLMSQDWLGLQQGAMKPELQEQITQLGLDYRLMTQFTSFVAVEDKIVTKDGKPQRVEVPVEMPEGVSHEGVFGEQKEYGTMQAGAIGGGMVSGNRAAFSSVGSMPMYLGGATQTVEVQASATPVLDAAKATGQGLPASPPPMPRLHSDYEYAETPDAKPVGPSTPQRRLLESKLQPAVLAALDCFRKGNAQAACENVHQGKMVIEVLLAESSPAARVQLQALGFELRNDHASGRKLVGSLAVDKLDDLVRLPFVQFIAFERR